MVFTRTQDEAILTHLLNNVITLVIDGGVHRTIKYFLDFSDIFLYTDFIAMEDDDFKEEYRFYPHGWTDDED